MTDLPPEDRPDLAVSDATPGVLELRVAGVINLPELRAAFAELVARCARKSDRRVLLFDAEAVSRFGRGAVVEASRWIARNARSFDVAITVTRSPSLKSAVLALSACAPGLRYVVVAERAEAESFLRGAALPLTG